ncbi:MAG: integration host factor subunit beta [Candidatus Fibromonas sp.]|jgi:nucleoid DNA-binding protein|nr:integration host factor subunit beta [Candidatus Fibromonas sp.]
MPITKSDLINDAAILCGVTRDYAKIIIEQFFDVVKDTIKEGKSLEIRGFGTFSPKTCNPRIGRNLQTGELIPLAASKSMNFKFSTEIKTPITSLAPKVKEVNEVKEAASEQAQAHEFAETDLPLKNARIQ